MQKKTVTNAQMLENQKILKALINHPDTKVSIDRSVFLNTEEEKLRIKEEKSKYKQSLKK